MNPRFILASALTLLGAALPAVPADVLELRLQNEIIHSVTAEYVTEGIAQAEKSNASAVLLVLNTPGGLEPSMRAMVDAITRARVPVIVYVAPQGSRAASAGFFILLAADVAAMAPGTTTGAASPVLLGGGETDSTLKKKIMSDAAAYLRSYVSKRGRPVDVAEKAVTEAKSFTDQEALKAQLIEVVAESREKLLAALDGREIKRFDGRTEKLALADARVEVLEMSQRQRFLSRLIDPNIAFLLFMIGVLGLSIEINHPGFIVPGVLGGICCVLALFALHLLPVNYVGVLLILLGLVLFVLEAKFTSKGILGAGGVAALVLGALFLIESPPIPELQVRLEIALSVAIPFAVITVILLRLVLKSRAWRVATGREGMLGQVGEVRQEIGGDAQKGMVMVVGELWCAVAREKIGVGQQVRVVGMEGLLLKVEPYSGGWEKPSPEKESRQ